MVPGDEHIAGSLQKSHSGLSTSIPSSSSWDASFFDEEIGSVISNSPGDKIPSPDGFNFQFFKSKWDLIQHDVKSFLNEFHQYVSLPKALTSSFLVLIPEHSSPQGLHEFMPILLIGHRYKIISTLLSHRLKGPLDMDISICQIVFLPKRQVLDGILAVNEVLYSAKWNKLKCLVMKIDFEKAFDSVNWSYHEEMMRSMSFCQILRNWMKVCLFSSSVSVLVNSSPTKEIKITKILGKQTLQSHSYSLLQLKDFPLCLKICFIGFVSRI